MKHIHLNHDHNLLYDQSVDANRKDGWRIMNKSGVDGSMAYGGNFLYIIYDIGAYSRWQYV